MTRAGADSRGPRFTVYGVRVKGEREVRYIGQTAHTPEHRLVHLRGEHGGRWNVCQRPCASHFLCWLHQGRANIEAFEIAVCATRAEAKELERATIAICLKLNHRLFNGDFVPRHLRRSQSQTLVFLPVGERQGRASRARPVLSRVKNLYHAKGVACG